MALSETKSREDRPREKLNISGYLSIESERRGAEKGGGGLCLLYRDTLRAHPWHPTISPSMHYLRNERQWLLIQGTTERLAFLHVYAACQSHESDEYIGWNTDLFTLLTSETLSLKAQGFSVLALGDFNTRVGRIPGMELNTSDTNNNFPMFTNFIRNTNPVIINALPIITGLFTRFRDSSGRPGTQSVLDYGLRDSDSVHTITSFIIDSDERFNFNSDHALLEATISFGDRVSVNWQVCNALHFKFTSKSSFKQFQEKLKCLASSTTLDDFSNLSTENMLAHLLESLQESGKQAFGLKVKQIRSKQRLSKYILGLIQTKNHLCRRVKEAYISTASDLDHLKEMLVDIKLQIKDEICKLKIKRRTRIRMKILKNDPSRKKFWSFLRNQFRAAGNLTGKYKQ